MLNVCILYVQIYNYLYGFVLYNIQSRKAIQLPFKCVSVYVCLVFSLVSGSVCMYIFVCPSIYILSVYLITLYNPF